MRDFPVFSTENGVGSLVLKEIPYTGVGFVKIHDVSDLPAFLDECVSFSRMAGAKQVYASGNADLMMYPYHTKILRMCILRENIPDTDAGLFPVTEGTLSDFQRIYNARMRHVPNASYMTDKDAEELLKRKDGYFVHRGAALLGMGIASGDTITCVISCVPGAGETVLCALNHALGEDIVQLTVASENIPAMRLYERIGFSAVEELSCWYKIF